MLFNIHINTYVCVKRYSNIKEQSVANSLGSLSVPFNFQTQEEKQKLNVIFLIRVLCHSYIDPLSQERAWNLELKASWNHCVCPSKRTNLPTSSKWPCPGVVQPVNFAHSILTVPPSLALGKHQPPLTAELSYNLKTGLKWVFIMSPLSFSD